ncbi:hypothetical protein ACFVT8_21185 [Lysinibacillus sp. NPDC058147]|uniref:hypothetical protein n=1 Tax=unclassified Lysinibacillus TaxID=2636778 RepID=UPI0036DA4C75
MSRLGQHDVGQEGVITGCDVFSLRSSACSPAGKRVARSGNQSRTDKEWLNNTLEIKYFIMQ